MTRASYKGRYGVAGLLVVLFVLTYLDRVCISVAGPLMQRDLRPRGLHRQATLATSVE